MPARPPVFRPPGWRERDAWQPAKGRRDKRLRGRAGMRDRAAVLADEPFCRACLAEGKYVASDEVDHIVPLSWGGSEDRSNKQALCKPHHDAKSLAERQLDRDSAKTHEL